MLASAADILLGNMAIVILVIFSKSRKELVYVLQIICKRVHVSNIFLFKFFVVAAGLENMKAPIALWRLSKRTALQLPTPSTQLRKLTQWLRSGSPSRPIRCYSKRMLPTKCNSEALAAVWAVIGANCHLRLQRAVYPVCPLLSGRFTRLNSSESDVFILITNPR